MPELKKARVDKKWQNSKNVKNNTNKNIVNGKQLFLIENNTGKPQRINYSDVTNKRPLVIGIKESTKLTNLTVQS